MKKMRVAIVGAGNIARTAHIPSYLADGRAEIVALCDSKIESARAAASLCGFPMIYGSIDEILASEKPDAVSVCVPNSAHYDAVLRAIDSGAHVLCEKPPALNSRESREMEFLAMRKKKVLAYNFHLRASPEIVFLKGLQKSGTSEPTSALGTVYASEARYIRRRGIPGWGSFTDSSVQGGGALIDIGVHALDLAWHLMGEPVPVSCLATTSDRIGTRGGTGDFGAWSGESFGVEDSAFGFILFEGGVSLSLQASWALNMEERKKFSVRLYGDCAGAELFPLRIFDAAGTRQKSEGQPEDNLADTTVLYQKSVSAFLDACEGKGNPLCSARDGTIVQSMIDALYLSARTGSAAPIFVERDR